MIAVIFEFTPREGRVSEYLELAAALKPELERADGFISIERYESITAPGRFVSISFWRDEQAVRHGATCSSTARRRPGAAAASSPATACAWPRCCATTAMPSAARRRGTASPRTARPRAMPASRGLRRDG